MKLSSILLFALLPLVTGCGHKPQQAKVPMPPSIPEPQAKATNPAIARPTVEAVAESKAIPAPVIRSPIENEKPLYTELGLASWYGPPYHNRRGANGEIYDMNQMTAAHRTLPLNSIVRVTNPQTGNSAIVRITDRGPFIGERMLDLSLAAAKAVGVWTSGVAWIRMEVLETPAALDSGGKWEVQIGAFDSLQAATQMKQSIISRYHPIRVVEFSGPTGEWVRIRVENDDRELAEQISRSVSTPEGGVFLVRVD
jgi:peptidoglycan lytic transglycosylase